jgi:hypothetical protein
VIRVGEKNNFNMSKGEIKELDKYKDKGDVFVNSNAFNPIDSTYPSIVTINPYMKFVPLRGDISNVKACRIKVFRSFIQEYRIEQVKCIEYCIEQKIPMLLTFMRYRSIKTAEKYSGIDFRSLGYVKNTGYLRPTKEAQNFLIEHAKNDIISNGGNPDKLLFVCDQNGTGCPACGNCYKLTYGYKNARIKALNLSISGVYDRYGKQGICPYHCPDCFAKLVTFGKRPACDRLVINRKIAGKVNHI